MLGLKKTYKKLFGQVVLFGLLIIQGFGFNHLDALLSAKDQAWVNKVAAWDAKADNLADDYILSAPERAELDTLAKERPVEKMYRDAFIDLLEKVLNINSDMYGIDGYSTDRTLANFASDVVNEDTNSDFMINDMVPPATLAVGKQLLSLMRLANTIPDRPKEIVDSLKAVFDASGTEKIVIVAYVDPANRGEMRYLKVDSNGYLTAGSNNPVDRDSNFQMLVYQDKVGLKSRSGDSTNKNLRVRKVDLSKSAIFNSLDSMSEQTKKTDTQIIFDATTAFNSTSSAEQHLVADGLRIDNPEAIGVMFNGSQVQVDAYKLRGFIYDQPNPVKDGTVLPQDGYLTVDEDGFLRTRNVKDSVLALNNESAASIFIFKPYSDFYRELDRARATKSGNFKIETFKKLVKNRGAYIRSNEELRILLEEIEIMLDVAADDAAMIKTLQESTNSFNELMSSLSTQEPSANSFSLEEISERKSTSRFDKTSENGSAEDWLTSIRKQFGIITGLVPKNFAALIFPEKVVNLNLRFDKLSETTIDKFLSDFAIVIQPEELVQAFPEDVKMLRDMIQNLQLKNAYKDKYGQSGYVGYTAWQQEASPQNSAGKLYYFDKFMQSNIDMFIENLAKDLLYREKSSNGIEGTQNTRSTLTATEQAFFLKKAARLVDNREIYKENSSLKDDLRTVIMQAALNSMQSKDKELRALAGLLEEDQVVVFGNLVDMEARVQFLEKRRSGVKNIEEVQVFLANLQAVVNDRYRTNDKQLERLRSLVEGLGFTKMFKDNFEVEFNDAQGNPILVSAIVAKMAEDLKNVPTYNDLEPRLKEIMEKYPAGQMYASADVNYIYEALVFLADKVQEQVQAERLLEIAKTTQNNIGENEIKQFGAKLADFVKKILVTIETLKKKGIVSGDFGERADVLMNKINTSFAAAGLEAFGRELVWLYKNLIQGTSEERQKLATDLAGRISYHEAFRNQNLVNFPDAGGSTPYKDAFRLIVTALGTELDPSALFANLQEMTVDTTERVKSRYLSKVKTLQKALEKLEFNPEKTSKETVDLNVALVGKVVDELTSKKNFILISMAPQLEQIISALQVMTKQKVVLAFDALATYSERIMDLEKRVAVLKKDSLNDFVKDLNYMFDNLVQSTKDDLDRLIKIVNLAQIDPNFEGHLEYTKAWFKQKAQMLAAGPGLTKLVEYLAARNKVMIEAAKTEETVDLAVKNKQKDQLLYVIDQVNTILNTAVSSQMPQISIFNDTLNALKIRVMPEKTALLEPLIAKVLKLLDDLSKEKANNFKIDLEQLKVDLQDLFVTAGDDAKVSKADKIAKSIDSLTSRIAEALESERTDYLTVVEQAKRLPTVVNAGVKFDDILKTIKAGPTLTGINGVLKLISAMTELAKRDRSLVLELATLLEKNKSVYYTAADSETSDIEANQSMLNESVGYLKTVATYQLKKLPNEATVIENLAAKIDAFMQAEQSTVADLWTQLELALIDLKKAPLGNKMTDLTNFVGMLSRFLQNKVYATTAQITEILSMLSGPESKVTRSDLYLGSLSEELNNRLNPIIAEMEKPVSFKARAENLMQLISSQKPTDKSTDADKFKYEWKVADRLNPLVEDRDSAFKESYSLERLINALGVFRAYLTLESNRTLVGLAVGQKRPYEISSSKDDLLVIENNVKETSTRMSRKGKSNNDRIINAETLLKSSRNAEEVGGFFADLEYLIKVARPELTPTEEASVNTKLLQAARRVTKWQQAAGITNNRRTELVAKLGILEAEMARQISNTDRLRWLNLKLYGVPDRVENPTISTEELNSIERNTLLKIANDILNNSRTSSGNDLKIAVNALWDAYYNDNKIGQQQELEKLINNLTDTINRQAAGNSYRGELSTLESDLRSGTLTPSSVDNALAKLNSLVQNKAEALNDELSKLIEILKLARGKREIMTKFDGVKMVDDMLKIAYQPATHQELFRFIAGKLGLTETDGKPAEGLTADKTLQTSAELQNLMIIKLGQLVGLKEGVTDVSILQKWKSAMEFAISNELASKSGEINAFIKSLNDFIAKFQSSVFKTVSERIEDLRTDLKLIPQVNYGDAPQKILAFVDSLNPRLLGFKADAQTPEAVVGSAINEKDLMINFLEKEVRLHTLVFTNAGLKTKIDGFIAQAKLNATFDELATRLQQFVSENANFSAKVKDTFMLVLEKIFLEREKGTTEKKQYLITEVLNFVTAARLDPVGDKSKVDRINEIVANLETKIMLPFNELVVKKQFFESANRLMADFKESVEKYTPDVWYDNLVKLANQNVVNLMLQNRTKQENYAFLDRFQNFVTDVAEKVFEKSTDPQTKLDGESIIAALVFNVLIPTKEQNK